MLSFYHKQAKLSCIMKSNSEEVKLDSLFPGLEKDLVIGAPFSIWEKLRFEYYLLLLSSHWITVRCWMSCLEHMRSMTLKRRSLVAIAISSMSRSPRLALFCLWYFLSLPDEILESDLMLHTTFGIFSASSSVRKQVEMCADAILICFPSCGGLKGRLEMESLKDTGQ